MSTGRLAAAVSLAALALACDGGGGATSEDVARYCKSRCDHAAHCDRNPPASCQADCQAGLADIYAGYRQEYLAALEECVHFLACTSDEEDCQNIALQRVATDPVKSPTFQQCRAAWDRCQSAGKAFAESFCPLLMALTDAGRERAAPCLDRPCEELSGCLKQILGS